MAMRSIGVRELKQRTSEVVQRVRTSGETIEVTVRGEVVALLVPAERRRPTRKQATALSADMDRLAAEIWSRWPKRSSATTAVRTGRRG